MSSSWESKKQEGRELHAAIEDLNKRRNQRMLDINKLQTELQVLCILITFLLNSRNCVLK